MGVSLADAASRDDAQNSVRRAQLASYMRQAPINSLSSIAVATWQVYALWSFAPRPWLVAWYGVICAIALLMLRTWQLQRRTPPRTHVSRRALSKAAVWSSLTGALWGSSAMFIGPMAVEERTLAVIGIIAMASGAATTLAAIPRCAITFILGGVLPTSLALLHAGDPVSLLLSGLMLAYLLALLASTRVVYSSFLDSVRADERSERTLREFEQARREWLEISDSAEAFALLDSERRLMLWSESFRRLLDLPPGSLDRGRAYRDVLVSSRGSRAVNQGARPLADWIAEQLDLLDRPGTVIEQELEEGRWVRSQARRTQGGHSVVLHVDIAALKQREAELLAAHRDMELQNRRIEETSQELAEARDAALRANEAKSTFLANMSHELRTPLNAIIGFSEIIEREMFGPVGSEKYRGYVGDIRSSGRHLLVIINDILDMSKIEARKMELHEQAVDVDAMIGECLRVLMPRAASGGIAIAGEVEPKLPAVHADATRLKQIVVNLLSNAVKFTDAGGRVTVRAELAPSGDCAISVIDTGRGMEREEIEIALQPFRQVSAAYTREHEGTGLGLPLAKALAELHGGKLEIDSQPGIGTAVTVTLPSTRLLTPADQRATA